MEHIDKKGCYKVEIILLAPLFSMLNPGGKFDKKGCYKVEIILLAPPLQFSIQGGNGWRVGWNPAHPGWSRVGSFLNLALS